MKALLEFSLPEERVEHRWAIEGGSYACAIRDFGNFIWKFEDFRESLTVAERSVLEQIRKKWGEHICDLVGLDDD